MRKPKPVDPDAPEEFHNPVTQSERVYSDEELEFMVAVNAYQRANDRRYPTWSEVLAVAKARGYRKVARPGPLPVFRRQGDRRDREEEARDLAEG